LAHFADATESPDFNLRLSFEDVTDTSWPSPESLRPQTKNVAEMNDHIRNNNRANRPWTPEEDALLGTMFDAEVVARTGRQVRDVYARRRHLGIPAYRPNPGGLSRPWTPEEDALLGTLDDLALAEKLDRPGAEVTRRRRGLGIPAYIRQFRSGL
jgi:hypothetical protein